MGYLRGKRRGDGQVALKAKVKLQRREYLEWWSVNKRLPIEEQFRMVYMDESYIHHHYHRHENSLWDPNDELDLQQKMQHKGKRYCIIGAIIEPNPRVRNPTQPEDRGHVVPGLLRQWEAGLKKPARKQNESDKDYDARCKKKLKESHSGDYHKNFDDENFCAWFRDLLRALPHQPCAIAMDNASYHKAAAPVLLKIKKMLKPQLVAFLKEKGGADYSAPADYGKITCARLREAIYQQLNVNDLELTHVQEILNEFEAETGIKHIVVYTPPYHSDLQPIELLWAEIKGRVGRQYDDRTTFKNVGERLHAEFVRVLEDKGNLNANINRTIVEAIIGHTDKLTAKMARELEEEDAGATEPVAPPEPVFPEGALDDVARPRAAARSSGKAEADDGSAQADEDGSSEEEWESDDSSESSEPNGEASSDDE